VERGRKKLTIESIGTAAVTGFVTTVITILGWNRRLDKHDEMITDLERSKVTMSHCDHKHDEMRAHQDKILSELTYLRGRVDNVYDKLFNGARK
jgi:hypothetical protein